MRKKLRYEKILKVDTFMKNYFDEELCLSRCQACTGYKKTWSCPEFEFNVKEYWGNFTEFRLIVEKVPLYGIVGAEEAEERLHSEKPTFNHEMRKLEELKSGSRALYAQECEECTECARLKNQSCRFPDIMRYSVESLGGNAVKMVKSAMGFDILWVKDRVIPEYYVLVGGLLY